jgi:hypothetical protein
VSVSLWNDLATTTGQELLDMVDSSPIIAIKSLRVSDFQGISSNLSSIYELNLHLMMISWFAKCVY